MRNTAPSECHSERSEESGQILRCAQDDNNKQNTKFLHIAVGVLSNIQGQVLICQRPSHKIYPGEWEFPGGKVEAGESAEQALTRELHEELGIRVSKCRPLIRLRYAYPELAVDLDTWRVDAYDGVVMPSEHPNLAWVLPEDLPRRNLLAGNRPIVSALRLPAHYVFTPPSADFSWLRERLDRLPEGALLRLRLPECSDAQYKLLARDLMPHCRQKDLRLMLDREPGLVQDIGAAGWHATSQQLRKLKRRPVPDGVWFGASCHNAEGVRLARDLGADFVVMGPVLKTFTHPDQAPLGWGTLQQLTLGAGLPVYAIGGMLLADISVAQAQGALGVAGISAYWQAASAT